MTIQYLAVCNCGDPHRNTTCPIHDPPPESITTTSVSDSAEWVIIEAYDVTDELDGKYPFAVQE